MKKEGGSTMKPCIYGAHTALHVQKLWRNALLRLDVSQKVFAGDPWEYVAIGLFPTN